MRPGARGTPTGRTTDPDRTADRGSAAVEFALLLPVVLLIVFGLIDFGRMLNAQLTVNQAAREGARATALVDADQGDARVTEASRPVGAVGRTIQDCPASPGSDDDAIVDVTYDFSFVTPLAALAGFGDGVVLRGHGVMPCLR
ncbi:TadE/TadG family type IV pilus assembly protein [Micromonospora cathayae]|uniref:Pilus assembly protein n=1 Tax=Micromonospora cathayae TaxID=3028804 RepID=A0ABY7ZUX3_9ACTN|nr:TadE family protein [Micromonospora sp. HUAS 3]WDZ85599.1 pilus assembly protein [Micromonospora sp. HUAS 3]